MAPVHSKIMLRPIRWPAGVDGVDRSLQICEDGWERLRGSIEKWTKAHGDLQVDHEEAIDQLSKMFDADLGSWQNFLLALGITSSADHKTIENAAANRHRKLDVAFKLLRRTVTWADVSSALIHSNNRLIVRLLIRSGTLQRIAANRPNESRNSVHPTSFPKSIPIAKKEPVEMDESVRSSSSESSPTRRIDDIDSGFASHFDAPPLKRKLSPTTNPFHPTNPFASDVSSGYESGCVTFDDSVVCDAEEIESLCNGNSMCVVPVEPAPRPPKPMRVYQWIVFMTYSSDGTIAARHVQDVLKMAGACVVTTDKLNLVANRSMAATIERVFDQCHYIIPILTPGYIRDIADDEFETRDQLYVKDIYDRYAARYHNDRCRNHYVRPVFTEGVTLRMVFKLNVCLQGAFEMSKLSAFVQQLQYGLQTRQG